MVFSKSKCISDNMFKGSRSLSREDAEKYCKLEKKRVGFTEGNGSKNNVFIKKTQAKPMSST